ncbi:MAG: glycosyltransferase family 1 protein [Proteobacteria bacterium]|nr:glycosyltransferase family 1 protein [Pseudomonadota bacterium]
MRIAYFSETFLPRIDGIVNTTCYLLDHLEQRQISSVLFAPAGGPARYGNTPIIGFKGYSAPFYPEMTLVPPFVDVETHLDAFQPDLIHVLGPFSFGIAGLRYARRRKIPLVASYHTDVTGYMTEWSLNIFRHSFAADILHPPMWAFLRWMHNHAGLNLCPSSVTKKQLARKGFNNLKVWTRGVDTQRFNPARRSRSWRSRLSRGKAESTLLVYVGRLSREKRVHWLHPIVKALPGVRLAIVGDGPYRHRLETLFADTATTFTGYLQGSELADAYACADIFVFPSANETLGNVVLEAMSSGLPVVAPRSGGVLDNVSDGKTGLLFDREKQSALVDAVRTLVRDELYAHRLGRAGRAQAEQQSWSHVLNGLLTDYEDLIGRCHGHRRAWRSAA